MNIGAGVAALSICLLIFLIDSQPRPVKDNQVPYCIIDYKAIVKRHHLMPNGKLVEKKKAEWVQGYGPCSLQDKYFYT
jgi:hypothetical protein